MSDERFIPFLRSEVTALCAADTAPGDRDTAAEVHRLLAGVLHQRYRRVVREVEADYFLLHPPEYARGEAPPAEEARVRARARLERLLGGLAETAGYTRITQEELAASMPMGEITPPEDVAEVIAFLASGRAPHTSGATIDVTGADYVR